MPQPKDGGPDFAARRAARLGKPKRPPRKIAGTRPEQRVPRDELFIDAYLASGQSAPAAAEAVGLARGTGVDVVRRLRGKIEARVRELAARAEFCAQEVIDDLRDAVRFDPRRLYDEETGKLLPVHELD